MGSLTRQGRPLKICDHHSTRRQIASLAPVRVLVGSFLLAVILSGVFSPRVQAQGSWSNEVAKDSQWPGYVSIALGPAGDERIVYWTIDKRLRHVARTGSTWTLEQINSAAGQSDNGRYTSLAVDDSGYSHVAYWIPPLQDFFTLRGLRYSRRDGSGWHVESVDSTAYVPALALGGDGAPSIAYRSVGRIVVARKLAGIWSFETADTAGAFGPHIAIAIDPEGDPRVCYYEEGQDDLRYAERSAGAWIVEIVDAAGNVGEGVSLSLDSTGDPRIAYRDGTNGDLRFASRASGAWTLETVDAVGDVGWSPSLQIDASGEPQIAYVERPPGSIRFASRAGGAWSTPTVHPSVSAVGIWSPLTASLAYRPGPGYRMAYPVGADDFEVRVRSRTNATGIPAPSERIERLAVYPNVISESPAMIRPVSPPTGRAFLGVYDPGGRLVRSLAPAAGRTSIEAIAFDGRDDAGRPLAAGVYFVLMKSDTERVSRRITIVR